MTATGYFGRDARDQDQVVYIDANTRASSAAQLGADYNAHLLESILKHVVPELGWR